MRAITLTVTTLCLAVLAHGLVDYNLKCNQDEVGIRWPSYHSNSDYYVCTRIGGKQIKMSCNAGELFTFVLQACTAPGKFIPPPPMDILPSSSLNPLPPKELPGLTHTISGAALPKPMYPTEHQPPIAMVPQNPPVLTVDNSKPPNLGSPAFEPSYEGNTGEQHVSDGAEEEPAPVEKPNSPPNKQKPVPVPPTPEPTPPVVKKPPTSVKKPPTALRNKPPVKPQKKPESVARKQPPKKATL